MDDTLPLYPSESGACRAFGHSRWPSRQPPVPFETHAGFERERLALAAYWRRL
ncbi:MAG: hypothetical protein LC118_00225 [Dehalococcoidia bacterium]|nr:hypothetical protein [Dehalococcoidia bacterium]